MRRRRASSFAGWAVAAGALAAAQSCGSRRSPGWEMTAAVSSDSGTSTHGLTGIMTAEILGNRVRFAVSGMAGSAFGNYMIVDSGTKTLTSVYPKGRLAVVSHPAEMTSGGSLHVTMVNRLRPGYSVEDLGPGEPVLGHRTHHYRESFTYDAIIKAGGDSCSSEKRHVAEVWVTSDSGVPDWAIISKSMSTLVSPAISSDMMKQLATARGQHIAGVALKTLSTVTSIGTNGDSSMVHSKWEVTAMRHVAIDATEFQIPSGYKINELRKPVADSRLDSVARREANREAIRRIRARFCGAGGT
jgi:hypothetical protein